LTLGPFLDRIYSRRRLRFSDPGAATFSLEIYRISGTQSVDSRTKVFHSFIALSVIVGALSSELPLDLLRAALAVRELAIALTERAGRKSSNMWGLA